MPTEGITITNTNINSSNPVFIQANTPWNYSYNKKINSEEEISNFTGDEWGITEVDQEGITNPTITIHGVLNIDEQTATISVNGVTATRMTEQLLKKFMVDKDEPTYVHIRIGSTPSFVSTYDGTAVTEITGSLGSYVATAGIKCIVQTVNINSSIRHKSIETGGQGVRIPYTITLKETA